MSVNIELRLLGNRVFLSVIKFILLVTFHALT